MMNNLAAQEVVDEVVDTLQNWTATLPFMDVEGIGTNGQPVDLFSYTSSHKKLPEGIGGPPPEVIFDRNKYRTAQLQNKGCVSLLCCCCRGLQQYMGHTWALPVEPVD